MNIAGTGKDNSQAEALFRQDIQLGLIKSMADFLPVLLIVYEGHTGKIRFTNRQFKEVLGFSQKFSNIQSLIFPADLEILDKSKEYSGSSSRNNDRIYCRFTEHSGKILVFDINIIKLASSAEEEELTLLIAQENLGSEKPQPGLVKNNELEQALNFGTFTYFPETGNMEWSEGLYRVLGYIDQQNINPDFEFFARHFKGISSGQLKDSLCGASDYSWREEEFDIQAGSSTRRISVRSPSLPKETNRGKYFSGIVWDITRYHNLYNDLLSYKRMIREKEYFLNTGSWEYDLVSMNLVWSDGMYQIFGYNDIERNTLLINDDLLYKHLLSREAIEQSRNEWEHFLRENDHYTREMKIRTNDGRKIRIESFGRIIRDANGQAIKVIGATRDITQLKEYELKLESKVRELARINKELEEFAYVASHDLQEPLRKITTFSERLSVRFSELLGSEGKMYLDRMVAATENMRMLIENLLEFSRTTRNSADFEKSDLGQVTKEVLMELELKLEETDARIEIGDLPVLEVIPGQMKQLFINLISNAVKFRKPGQQPVIKISSHRTDEKEKAENNLSGNYFTISVSDNGIGFEEEYAERIFKIFQRLNGKSEYPGSGIGLAICKKIIDFHNGIIYARSKPGKGSDFIFILPENQY